MNRSIIANILILFVFIFVVLCSFQSDADQGGRITTEKEQKRPTPTLSAL